jgi:hypothetical protein
LRILIGERVGPEKSYRQPSLRFEQERYELLAMIEQVLPVKPPANREQSAVRVMGYML